MMIRITRDDTKWAIASRVTLSKLRQIATQLPRELQGEGSTVASGRDGFSALLVFGDLPSEMLARQLLALATPVYLLDFNDDAPVTLKLDHNNGRISETRLDDHPAAFLEARGIVAPGYEDEPSPVRSVGVVEGVTLAEAKRAMPTDTEVRLMEHPRGVLVDYAPAGGKLADDLGKRGFLVFRNPEDGWFCCVACEPGKADASFSPVEPDPNRPPIDNVLGETTLEGIVRVLSIPGELLGLGRRS
jgi:hypothetical protein